MIRAGRITRRRADAAIALVDQAFRIQGFVSGVAPELPADHLVQTFRERLGQAVGQRLRHDRMVDVMVAFKACDQFVATKAGGHRKSAEVIRHAARARGDEISQRVIGLPGRFALLLTQAVEHGEGVVALLIGI